MLPMYVRNAVAAILVFDISRYDSFRNLEYWITGEKIGFFQLNLKISVG